MEILIDNEEKALADEMFIFLKTLTPDTQEKIKTILWWEGLKIKDFTKKDLEVK